METFQLPQPTKLAKAFVEDHFSITPASLCKNILQPLNDPWADDNVGQHGVRLFKKHGKVLEVTYEIDLELGSILLNSNMPGLCGVQDVLLDPVPTEFGKRAYFVCEGCEARVNKLFLRASNRRWQCRKCQNLTWKVKRYNKRSAVGVLGYYLDRGLKLQEKQEQIKRISYAGSLTRKARAIMGLIAKWTPLMSQ